MASSNSPASLSGVCLRPGVMSLLLSLAGLLWYGGKYATAEAHTLPDRNPSSATQYSPQAGVPTPTIPSDYDFKSYFLSKLRQSDNTDSYEKSLTGSKSHIHKRQTNDSEVYERLLAILQRLQSQREANTALTMPSLRFR